MVYNQTIFKITDLFVLYFSFKTHMPAKKYGKNAKKNVFNRTLKEKLKGVSAETYAFYELIDTKQSSI